jgi:RNA polymerase sigma-70 factor (ECF subfamily)
VCRFKTWLLNMTRWRIQDQIKKRKKETAGTSGRSSASYDEDTNRTATVNRVPDPVAANFEALFETRWRENLFATALERVKLKFSLKQYQMFDLLVLKEWPAADVANSLGVTLANVYVTRHRISAAIKKETNRLETQLEQAARRQSSEPGAVI